MHRSSCLVLRKVPATRLAGVLVAVVFGARAETIICRGAKGGGGQRGRGVDQTANLQKLLEEFGNHVEVKLSTTPE